MATGKSTTPVVPVDLGDDPDGDMEGYDGAGETTTDQVAESTATTTPTMSKEDRDKALREVYSEATRELRETHRAEFDQLRVKLAAARGIQWEPPMSAAEKAEQQVRDLVAQFPELADRLGIVGEETADE